MDEDSSQVPSQHDMAEVHSLSGEVARLEQELELARLRLRDAWARVPYDAAVLRRPWRADIAVSCRVCGKATTWRTARGLAEHQPECPTVGAMPRRGVSDSVWDLLKGLDGSENDESLDDD